MDSYTIGGFYSERSIAGAEAIWIKKDVFTRTFNDILREMGMTLEEYREVFDQDNRKLRTLDNALINALTVHQIWEIGEDLGFTLQDFFRAIVGA